MRVACVIYFYGQKYQGLGGCALSSFKKHHPDVDLYHINDTNINDFKSAKHKNLVVPGAFKYMIAAELMIERGYEKVIVLGGDTITCSRLDEFLDDNEHDILPTLDYPYRIADFRGTHLCPDSETHLNSDVICFNNASAIVDIVKISSNFPIYKDQGALNYVAWSGKYDYSTRIVDGPYDESKVVYNARAKGNICGQPGEKPWGKFTNQFYVKDNKLFTGDHKQIKVWHYCEGFGTVDDARFMELVNNWIYDWFNDETKIFFKENCACGDFFEKEFKF